MAATRKVLYPKRIPEKIAATVGFAPAVQVGEWVWISALSGLFVQGDKIAIADGPEAQAATIREHLDDILSAAGGSADDLVDLTVLVRADLTDADVAAIGRVLGHGLKPGRHADTWIRANLIGPKEQAVQVKAVALIK